MRHEQRMTSTWTRSGLSWIELLVVIGIIALLAALILPAVRSVRTPALRTMCLNNMRNIALAVLNYEADHGALPPAYTVDSDGQPLHSWRTLILPYLERTALYESIDLSKPWDDPANAAALKTVVEVYQCPVLDPTSNLTTYAAMVGPDACFLPTESRRLDEIADGSANTLMLIDLPAIAAVPWMAPQDDGVEFLSSWPSDTKFDHGERTTVIFADAHGRFLEQDISPELRAALITVDGGESVEDF